MSSGRFLGGLLLGGAIGTLIGMLIAPRSGEETRELIGEEFSCRVNRSADQIKGKTSELRERAYTVAEQLREKGQQVAADLEETGRETLEKLRSSVGRGSQKPVEESSN